MLNKKITRPKLAYRPITSKIKVYAGHSLNSGPFKVLLQNLSQPGITAQRYASIAIFYYDVLTNIAKIAPGVTMRFDVSGQILYVNLLEAHHGVYAYDKWAILQLGSEKTRAGQPISDQSVFYLSKLHPKIRNASGKLFNDKHYSQAIFEAFKLIENLVKEKSGKVDLSGKPLMQTVFSANRPILTLNSLSNRYERDEQEGFMDLFTGAMMGIRDPKAHLMIKQKDPKKAFEYLVFASLLVRKIEEAKVNTN